MLKKIFLPLLIILLLPLLSSSALSQAQEIKEYKVIKGDTLWDISVKELIDPFLWPKIWKENPEIKNPDKIYPNQTIKIPLYLLQKEKQEKPVPAPVVRQEPPQEIPMPVEIPKPRDLVEKNLLLASGYISDSISSLGRIAGSPSGKNLFGNDDLIYVTTDNPVKIGDRFYIVRAGQKVYHPATNKKIGYVIEILGIAEINKFEYGETIAKITKVFNNIVTGDFLDTFYEITPPVASKSYRKPSIDGYVIATRNFRIMNGDFDIVYIDKGKNDGIEIGDLLKTIDVRTSRTNDENHKVPNGTIQIINYKDTTSTAIVRESSDPITSGNLVTHVE